MEVFIFYMQRASLFRQETPLLRGPWDVAPGYFAVTFVKSYGGDQNLLGAPLFFSLFLFHSGTSSTGSFSKSVEGSRAWGWGEGSYSNTISLSCSPQSYPTPSTKAMAPVEDFKLNQKGWGEGNGPGI